MVDSGFSIRGEPTSEDKDTNLLFWPWTFLKNGPNPPLEAEVKGMEHYSRVVVIVVVLSLTSSVAAFLGAGDGRGRLGVAWPALPGASGRLPAHRLRSLFNLKYRTQRLNTTLVAYSDSLNGTGKNGLLYIMPNTSHCNLCGNWNETGNLTNGLQTILHLTW